MSNRRKSIHFGAQQKMIIAGSLKGSYSNHFSRKRLFDTKLSQPLDTYGRIGGEVTSRMKGGPPLVDHPIVNTTPNLERKLSKLHQKSAPIPVLKQVSCPAKIYHERRASSITPYSELGFMYKGSSITSVATLPISLQSSSKKSCGRSKRSSMFEKFMNSFSGRQSKNFNKSTSTNTLNQKQKDQLYKSQLSLPIDQYNRNHDSPHQPRNRAENFQLGGPNNVSRYYFAPFRPNETNPGYFYGDYKGMSGQAMFKMNDYDSKNYYCSYS